MADSPREQQLTASRAVCTAPLRHALRAGPTGNCKRDLFLAISTDGALRLQTTLAYRHKEK